MGWSPVFAFFGGIPVTKLLSPIFHNTLIVGLLSFVFTRWQTEHKERKHTEQDFISIALLVLDATTLKVVSDLFQTFNLGSFNTQRHNHVIAE